MVSVKLWDFRSGSAKGFQHLFGGLGGCLVVQQMFSIFVWFLDRTQKVMKTGKIAFLSRFQGCLDFMIAGDDGGVD